MNLVIDEASDTGKGANTVVSLLGYFSAIMCYMMIPPKLKRQDVLTEIRAVYTTQSGYQLESSRYPSNPLQPSPIYLTPRKAASYRYDGRIHDHLPFECGT